MNMNTTRRGFMKSLSATAAITGAMGVSTLAKAAANAEVTEKVITIVNKNYPNVAAYPEVVRAFAEALQKADSPRMEPLSFVLAEAAKDSEIFDRYIAIEFSVATNVLDLDATRKLELLWK